MLQKVELAPKSVADYSPIVGEERIEEVRSLGAALKGMRVVHVNATAYGGGVAEILQTLVPLMRDVGLDAEWQVIEGVPEFFNVTKAMHNGLQGKEGMLTKEMLEVWELYNSINAHKFEGRYDCVVVHDPQPAGLLHYGDPTRSAHWVWRCHIDTSQANPNYWTSLIPYIKEYPAAIFTMKEYVGAGLNPRYLRIIAPTIDPLSSKNQAMDAHMADAIVSRYRLDPSRPLLVQVSRFDPWKDPLGVIDAYRIVKEEIPSVQVALVGSMASDDPEGWDYYDRTIRHAGEDFDIHILHNFHGVGNLEINAFQTAADVVIQKSTREGFGLVVTEALWKGKAVIGGNVGGIPLQVIDGKTGHLVNDVRGCADKARYLLQHPAEASRLGEMGREHVRQNFLSIRELRDYLRLLRDMVSGE